MGAPGTPDIAPAPVVSADSGRDDRVSFDDVVVSFARRHTTPRAACPPSRVCARLRLAAASSAAAGNGRVELPPRARFASSVRVSATPSSWTFAAPTRAAAATTTRGRGPSSRRWRPRRCSREPSRATPLGVGRRGGARPERAPPVLPRRAAPSARVDAGDAPLEARVRALDARPAPCVTLRVRARDRDPTPVAAESLRRLLQHRVLAPGAAVHLARDDTPSADPNRNADPSSQSNHLAPPIVVHSVDPPDATCVRVTPATRVVLVDDDDHRLDDRRPVPVASSASAVLAGADDVLDALREAIAWPVAHADDARALGARFPTGVLLHGPPGVGKTASVLAVAAEVGAATHALSAGDVFGPYAGDSEARLRAAFRAAERDTARGTPAVLIIDEIDAVCPARGADAGLHGSRVVAQLLTLMDDGADEDRDGTETSGAGRGERTHGGSNASTRTSRSTRSTHRGGDDESTKRVGPGASSTGKIRRRD